MLRHVRDTTVSQDGCGWKGPMEVIYSKLPAQTGPVAQVHVQTAVPNSISRNNFRGELASQREGEKTFQKVLQTGGKKPFMASV